MAPQESRDVTRILAAMSGGQGSAVEELLPLVYDELRVLAGSWFRGRSQGHTLQPTALVHEAYLKMVGGNGGVFTDRAHFFAVAATAMRHIIIDQARRRNAAKRSGQYDRVSIDTIDAAPERPHIDILVLDEALARLSAIDERKSRIVEMRLFGGLTGEAIAAVLGLSRVTVDADWQVARAWLRAELRNGEGA